jgi:hypothetical protein
MVIPQNMTQAAINGGGKNPDVRARLDPNELIVSHLACVELIMNSHLMKQ